MSFFLKMEDLLLYVKTIRNVLYKDLKVYTSLTAFVRFYTFKSGLEPK